MGPDTRTGQQIHLLAESRNRIILTLLEEADQPLHVKELAAQLVTEDVTIVSKTEYEKRLNETLLSLHHVRLPKLAEAELVEYDQERNNVTVTETTSLDMEWYNTTVLGEIIAHFEPGNDADEEGIKVIRGRESVIQYGRHLADEAEEELFCMYVNTDLLEEECVRRGQNALNRGVEMHLGSQNAEVRQLAQEHLPEATVWEPQLDWMNTPTYPRLGRLVFVDRRKVMLAILEEPDSDETHPEETAVVGEGEDHPLVVLIRELLGSRLNHLDYQSEAFTSRLTLFQ